MAARALAGPRMAALAFVLAVGWTACGHDTLRLLPAGEDAGTSGDVDAAADTGSPPPEMDGSMLDAGVDPDADTVFNDHTTGFGGSSNDPPTYDFDAGGDPGGQAGAPTCTDSSCGRCAPGDVDCLRCQFVSCDFRPSGCDEQWQMMHCAKCSEDVPCPIGQNCQVSTNQCLPACESSADCVYGSARKCELELGVCVECLGDSDCGGGEVCHYGRCFQCGEDSDCQQGEICVGGHCYECLTDSMCPSREPHCSFGGTCRECVYHDDCDPGELCNSLGFCYNPNQ